MRLSLKPMAPLAKTWTGTASATRPATRPEGSHRISDHLMEWHSVFLEHMDIWWWYMMIYGYVYKKTFKLKASNLLECIEVLYPVTQAYLLNRLIYYIILPYWRWSAMPGLSATRIPLHPFPQPARSTHVSQARWSRRSRNGKHWWSYSWLMGMSKGGGEMRLDSQRGMKKWKRMTKGRLE